MSPSKVSIFGAGNLAVHFGYALSRSGFVVSQVFSRTEEAARSLAKELNSGFITDPSDFDQTCDVVVFALNENALDSVLDRVQFSGQLVLHTSGSLPLDVFKNRAEHYGVIYPLQTFSKFRQVDFRDIPLFIEANSARNLTNLKSFASALSTKVMFADSLQRRHLHLSAVFANNFVNHFYTISSELVKKSGFTFDVLKPIILETALKAIESGSPANSQTGPAFRNNTEIINKHVEILGSQPDFQNLYTFVSESIMKMHPNDIII